MSENGISRRNFLLGAGAAAAVTAVGGVAINASTASAAGTDLPWAYTQQDPEKLARRAYEIYRAGMGCGEACWWPLVEALAADPLNDNQADWATLPTGMFMFAAGGVNGWGTVCGTVNGCAAATRMVGAPLVSEKTMDYYGVTPLPTNDSRVSFEKGDWDLTAIIDPRTPGTPKTGAEPIANVHTTVANSQLCHASISKWMAVKGFDDGSAEQKDRCAKACYDMMYNMVVELNKWLADKPGYVGPAKYASQVSCEPCHAPSGTTNVMAQHGKMDCVTCHDELPGDGHQTPNFGY